MQPILSIIIATRNRVKYCINAIETILDFNYPNFELVIQDNTENDELRKYIEQRVSDSRLKYNYTPPPFSSIDNFNAVIAAAKGRYLCLIGDDDAVIPDIFQIVEWAEQNNISAVVPTLSVIYRWPDACLDLNQNGLLSIAEITGNAKIVSTKNVVKKLMQNGGQNYLGLPFPKLYHGIVKREYLERIKEEAGNYVGGLSPDIYIAIGLAKHIDTIVELDYPLTLPGICGISTPVEEVRKKYMKLEDAPHFRDRGEYEWSELVPRFYSSANIWADSAIAAVKDLNLEANLKYFNVYHLAFTLLPLTPDYKDHIYQHLQKMQRPLQHSLYFITYWFFFQSKLFIQRVKHKLRFIQMGSSVRLLTNIPDVKSAVITLVQVLSNDKKLLLLNHSMSKLFNK